MPSKNRNRVNYQQRFDNYLDHYRRRYRFRNVAITAAAILFATVVVTLFTAVLGDTLAYSAWLYYPARLLLIIAIACIVFALLIRPSKRIKEADGAREFEQAVPSFAGRAETYLDMKRREVDSPFISLLAKDASKRATAAPVRQLLPTSEILGPVVAGTGLLVMCAWLFSAVPGEWRAGIQQLWFGWFKSDILPERVIAVEPGNTKLKLGDSLSVVATLEGFSSDFSTLYIRKQSPDKQNTDWETVEMNRQLDGSFMYTMYGISDPLDYYVASSFTKSDVSSVEVVIPPKIENIQLTYTYPEWTGQSPRVVNNGGDIAAVNNTQVELLIETDRPLSDGEIMIDDVPGKLELVEDLHYRTTLTVNDNNTEYQLADLLGDDRIMLTGLYDITVSEDTIPTISFTLPSGDRNATAIEEVTVIAEAADDFAVEAVKLHYSLNGGEWQETTLSEDNGYKHVFMLEEFTSEFNEPLLPGDLLTYYAEALDRESAASTDIQFIDIRPFERRYTQSQQSGQGGGEQQEPPPGEISQRQREILVATWNLIKEQDAIAGTSANNGAGRGVAPARGWHRRATPQQSILNDNAALLSDLQTKLAEQAETLAQRAEARQLSTNDPKVAQFVEYMQKAAEAMRPSAEQLNTQSLKEAVRHQQRALQFLRRGELLFNDITINQSQSNGQGSSAGQDMAEIYELEMDMAKNQYETPDSANRSSGGDGNQPEDDALNRLKDLAKRQKKLAEAAADKDELTMAERWEQEKLRRELEDLKRDLEQLQRNTESESQSAQGQSSEGQQQSQSQSQSSQGQSSQGQSSDGQSSDNQSAENQSGEQNDQQSAQQQAMQSLQEAIRGLQDNPENGQQSLQSASERLQESLEQMQAQRQQALQDQLADAAQSVRDLSEQQRDTAQQLRDAMQRSIEARQRQEFTSGLSAQQQDELAEQKRAMQRQLEAVRQQLNDAVNRFSEDAPQTSDKLQQALDELDANKAAELMGISGDLIEEGMAPQASLREGRVTDALRNLQQDLNEATQLAGTETGGPANEEITAADASQSLQSLRQALNDALNRNGSSQRELQQLEGANTGGQQQSGQQQSGEGQSGEGQPGEGQSGEGQSGEGQAQGNGSSQQPGTSRDGQMISGGRNSGSTSEAPIEGGQPQLIREATTQLEELANADIDGLSQATIEQMTELAEQMRRTTDSSESDRRIDADVRLLLRQLEQLELRVYKETQGISGIRSARTNKAPAGFDKRSADYFRRLSEEATGS